MADVYKGLTVRIGADTKQFKQELNHVNAATRQTTKQLRDMKAALAIDPGNLRVLDRQLDALANSAYEASTKVILINKELKKLQEDESLLKLEKETKDVALATQQAYSRYNEIDKKLESIYTTAKSITGIDFRKVFNRDKEIDKHIGEVSKNGVELTEDMVRSFHKLRSTWIDAYTDLNKYNKLNALVQLRHDAESTEAQIKKNAQALVDLTRKSSINRNMFGPMNEQFDKASAAVGTLKTRLSEIDAALKIDPTNVELLTAKTRTLQEVLATSKVELSAIKAKLDVFKGTGIKEIADAAVDAHGNFKTLEYDLETLRKKMLTVEETRQRIEAEKNSKLAEKQSLEDNHKIDTQQYRELVKELEVLDKELNVVSVSADELHKKLDTAQAVNECVDLTVAYEKQGAAIKEANQQLRDTSAIDANAEHMRKLSKRAEELSEQIIKTKTASSFNGALGNQKQAFDNMSRSAEVLKQRLAQVEEALRLDPGNLDLVKTKEDLLAEAADNAEARSRLLKKTIDNFDSSKIQALSKHMDEIGSSTKDSHSAMLELEATWKSSVGELKQAEIKLQDLKNKQKDLRDVGKENTDEYKRLSSEIGETKKKVDQLSDAARENEKWFDTSREVNEQHELQAALAQTVSDTRRVNNIQESMGQQSHHLAASIRNVGLAATASITPLVVQTGRAVIDSANDIDVAYRNMRKTVNGTEQQFESLRNAAIEFSTTHVTSAEQMLEIEAMGGQLGIGVEALEGFANTVSNLDIATNMNAEDIAVQLGQLRNILSDMSDETMPQFADAMVRLGNNSPALESNIMDVTSRIGSMASIVGFSTPEILAWATAVASTGQHAEAAGTAISKTMSDIESATAEGGESLEAFASVAQLSADEFAELWATDPSQAFQKFVEGLAAIDKAGGSVDGTLEKLGIRAVRQKQALEGLTQTTDVLVDSLTMSQDAWDGIDDQFGAAGDAAREAEKKSEGFSGSLSKLKNIAKAAAAELGEGVSPILSSLATMFEEMFESFSNMPEHTKTAIISIGALAASFGPLMTAIGVIKDYMDKRPRMGAFDEITGYVVTITKGIGGLITKIPVLGKALLKVKNHASDVAGIIKGFPGLWQAVATLGAIAIGGIINDFIQMREEAKKLESATRSLKPAFEDLGSTLNDAIGISSTFGISYKEMCDSVARDTDDLVDSMEEYKTSVEDSFAAFDEQSATLDTALATIEKYRDSQHLSEFQQEQLKNAVEKYNQITGDSLEIIDLATGELSENSDELQANADAWRKNAEAQAMATAAQGALEKQAEALVKLRNAQEKYNATYEEYRNAITEGDYIAAQNALHQLGDEISKNADLWRSAATDAGEFAMVIAEDSGDYADVMIESIKGLPDYYWETGLNCADALAASIKDGSIDANEAAQFISDSITGIISILPEDCEAYGAAMAESLAGAVASGNVSVDDALELISGEITEFLASSPEGFEAAGAAMVNDLAGAISDGSLTAQQAAQVLSAAVNGTVDDLPKDLKSWGEAASAALGEGLQDIDEQQEVLSNGLRDLTNNGGREARHGGRTVGEDYAGGVGKGLNNHKSLSGARSAASDLRNAISGVLDDSKTFSNIGARMAAAFSGGLSSARNSVTELKNSGGGGHKAGRSAFRMAMPEDTPMLMADFPTPYYEPEDYATTYAVETTRANYSVPTVTLSGDNTAEAVYAVGQMILQEFPYIISEYTPTMTSRDFSRVVKKYGR